MSEEKNYQKKSLLRGAIKKIHWGGVDSTPPPALHVILKRKPL